MRSSPYGSSGLLNAGSYMFVIYLRGYGIDLRELRYSTPSYMNDKLFTFIYESRSRHIHSEISFSFHFFHGDGLTTDWNFVHIKM
jgi:hypothetical protein